MQLLWQALESFSHEDRRFFLRFVWGRSRLPADANVSLSQPFKIQQVCTPLRLAQISIG